APNLTFQRTMAGVLWSLSCPISKNGHLQIFALDGSCVADVLIHAGQQQGLLPALPTQVLIGVVPGMGNPAVIAPVAQ
ncbi:MAG TPA: hypothetical protein VLM37_09295, partial [Fibrobacteraceae bacterium]|nr:hypothetical protein [Fibrobacteraceae bacterium]